jgi:hypothetical protein
MNVLIAPDLITIIQNSDPKKATFQYTCQEIPDWIEDEDTIPDWCPLEDA